MRMKKDRMLLGILFLIGSMALGCGIFAKECRENNAKREDINLIENSNLVYGDIVYKIIGRGIKI